jgi:MYXO-CTERM domain-containing protein
MLSTTEADVLLRCGTTGGDGGPGGDAGPTHSSWGCSVGGTAPIGTGLYLLLALALLLQRRRV